MHVKNTTEEASMYVQLVREVFIFQMNVKYQEVNQENEKISLPGDG